VTTHRNLKPHYAEPKGKSGPVIVIPAPLSESDDMQVDTFREPVEPRKCVRHKWKLMPPRFLPDGKLTGPETICRRCNTIKDEARSRRGRTSRNRGNALERWVNGLLGISNRGKFGGPDDGGGAGDWISVQTKSGNYFPKLIDRWLRAVPQRAGQMRGVVLVETPGAGTKRRALLVVDLYEAAESWGIQGADPYAVELAQRTK
jgi:hypothetical protein